MNKTHTQAHMQTHTLNSDVTHSKNLWGSCFVVYRESQILYTSNTHNKTDFSATVALFIIPACTIFSVLFFTFPFFRVCVAFWFYNNCRDHYCYYDCCLYHINAMLSSLLLLRLLISLFLLLSSSSLCILVTLCKRCDYRFFPF